MTQNIKNILISICGTSPAVITEAIWALSEEQKVLDEVVVITTTEGKAAIEKQLFGEMANLKKLRDHLPEEYAGFNFTNTGKYIKILSNADDSGNSTDIQQTDDTLPMGNDILDVLRKYTEKLDTKIYFSIAGGRKSMTAMGALCMSLVGRQQDELCHVLVDDKLVFGKPSFYFPSEAMHTFTDRDTKQTEEINGSSAKITLSKIPYVRIRNLFQEKFDRIPAYYSELVDEANVIALGKPAKKKLVIDTKEGSATLNGQSFKITGRPLAYLYGLAKHGQVITKTKDSVAENTLEVIEYFSPDLGLNIQAIIQNSSIESVSGAISELKKVLEKFDIMVIKRGHYGLDFDKVEVKVI